MSVAIHLEQPRAWVPPARLTPAVRLTPPVSERVCGRAERHVNKRTVNSLSTITTPTASAIRPENGPVSDHRLATPRDRAPWRRTKANRPLVFAHRGASGYAPENTLAAFSLGLARRADGLESDAWLATDGVPVLVHDSTIRLPGRRIPVVRRSSRELAALSVPSLADLYRLCGTDYLLSIDIEHPPVALPLIEVAEAFHADERLLLCSDDLATLGTLRARSPRVGLVCSTGPRRLGGLAALLPLLRKLDVDVVNLHWRHWTPAGIRLVHMTGMLAFGWDVQDELACDRMTELGLDGLYTDRPDRLVARLRGASTSGPS